MSYGSKYRCYTMVLNINFYFISFVVTKITTNFLFHLEYDQSVRVVHLGLITREDSRCQLPWSRRGHLMSSQSAVMFTQRCVNHLSPFFSSAPRTERIRVKVRISSGRSRPLRPCSDTDELIPTLAALFPQGEPVQEPVLTKSMFQGTSSL